MSLQRQHHGPAINIFIKTTVTHSQSLNLLYTHLKINKILIKKMAIYHDEFYSRQTSKLLMHI